MSMLLPSVDGAVEPAPGDVLLPLATLPHHSAAAAADTFHSPIRCISNAQYHHERFQAPASDSLRQFASLYFFRLAKLRPAILQRAGELGSDELKVCQSTRDLITSQPCLIVGTIYKDMQLKPCVLDEYMKDPIETLCKVSQSSSSELTSYTSDSDSLSLEDEHGRITLSGPPDVLQVGSFVTGIVAGAIGRLESTGCLVVERYLQPSPAPQRPLKRPESDSVVLLVSGLDVGSSRCNPLLPQLLADAVSGVLGGSVCHAMMSRVSRVIICGNSLCSRDLVEVDEAKLALSRMGRKAQKSDIDEALKHVDLYLEQLCACVDVDIMPGENDPANYLLPQKPLHPFLFPKARRFSSFTRLSNPCSLTVNGVDMLGSAGQNLDDMTKSLARPSPLDLAEMQLNWRMIAPTCPDTLGCFPFVDRDPFVLEQQPHVMFFGNQRSFLSEEIVSESGSRTRVVMLPSFAETGTCALLDLKTLQCEPFQFASV